MDSLFPFIEEEITNNSNYLGTSERLPREYSWDFEGACLMLQNGKPVIVEGIEAIKVWAYKALKTTRDKYFIYSSDYGNEINELSSSGLSGEMLKAEIKRILEECLLINPYITGVENIIATREDSYFNVSFKLVTSYGEVKISV